MAFDKSMLLTCLAVVLVLVTGVTIAVTGDLSDNIKKSGLEVGDYIETEMIETENGEVIYSDVSRNVITAIEIEDRKEVIYYDIIVDGENYGEIETNAESFLTLLIYDESFIDPTEVYTEDITTEFGLKNCNVYVYEFEIPGYNTTTKVYVGVDDGYRYYQNSVSVAEDSVITQEFILTDFSISI